MSDLTESIAKKGAYLARAWAAACETLLVQAGADPATHTLVTVGHGLDMRAWVSPTDEVSATPRYPMAVMRATENGMGWAVGIVDGPASPDGSKADGE